MTLKVEKFRVFYRRDKHRMSHPAWNGAEMVVYTACSKREHSSTTATDKFVVRFVGGTGRFAGAHGTGTGIVVVNLLTGAFEITIVGDIDF